MSSKRPTGPNVKKLICTLMAKKAVPEGGGIVDGLAFLSDAQLVVESAREATEEVFGMIDAVKAALACPPESDEEIAGRIVQQIEQQRIEVRLGIR